MVSRVCWEGVRVTLERAASGNLGYMPASGSRIEFPEWSRHMDPAQTPYCPGSGDMPGASGCAQGIFSWSSMGSGG